MSDCGQPFVHPSFEMVNAVVCREEGVKFDWHRPFFSGIIMNDLGISSSSLHK